MAIYESESNLINLCYQRFKKDQTIIQLIGSYLEYVENEVMLNDRRVTKNQLLG